MKWTLQEDIALQKLARKHFSILVEVGRFSAESSVCIDMHMDFASATRDAAALLFRLKNAGMLKFACSPVQPVHKQLFKCILSDDLPLYDFSVCPEQLKKKFTPRNDTQNRRMFFCCQ